MEKTIQALTLLFMLALAAGAAFAAGFEDTKALAEQGDASAQYNLGRMYYSGTGVARDYTKAREWYEKSAAQGNANAQAMLGAMYAEGLGVTHNDAKAREWLKKAAAQGNPNARAMLRRNVLRDRPWRDTQHRGLNMVRKSRRAKKSGRTK